MSQAPAGSGGCFFFFSPMARNKPAGKAGQIFVDFYPSFLPLSNRKHCAQHCRVKHSKYTALKRQLNCDSRWFKSSSEKQASCHVSSAVKEVKGQEQRENERAKKQDNRMCVHNGPTTFRDCKNTQNNSDMCVFILAFNVEQEGKIIQLSQRL